MNEPRSHPIRLLIVDDHEVVRIGLHTLLSRYKEIEVVGEANSVGSALAEAERLRPNVVLLDVRLPDGSGFEAGKQIQGSFPDTRVLILTSYADDDTVLECITAGADGFLLKEIGADLLVQAIVKVAAGQSILDPAVTRRVLERVKNPANTAFKSKLETLSPQESRVLALVAEGKTNKEIGSALGLSDKTVKNYLSSVLQKLQLGRRTQAATFFVQHSGK